MRNMLLAGIAAVAMVATPAAATIFTGSFTVTSNNVDPGLVVFTTPTAGSGSIDLALNTPYTIPLFDIATNEKDVGFDDFFPKAISVAFNFTAPTSFSGTITGSTFGALLLKKNQTGEVFWDDAFTDFNFGTGGLLRVALTDTSFGRDKGGLNSNPGTVNATFTYLSPSAVPEPATWAMMISGFGLVGGAMRRSRNVKTSVAYA